MTAETFAPLLTDRLILDPLRVDDAEAMFNYRSHAEVGRYQGWCPTTLDEVANFIRNNAVVPPGQRGTWYQLAIRLRGERKGLGPFRRGHSGLVPGGREGHPSQAEQQGAHEASGHC